MRSCGCEGADGPEVDGEMRPAPNDPVRREPWCSEKRAASSDDAQHE
jgi:hypothetical protein